MFHLHNWNNSLCKSIFITDLLLYCIFVSGALSNAQETDKPNKNEIRGGLKSSGAKTILYFDIFSFNFPVLSDNLFGFERLCTYRWICYLLFYLLLSRWLEQQRNKKWSMHKSVVMTDHLYRETCIIESLFYTMYSHGRDLHGLANDKM